MEQKKKELTQQEIKAIDRMLKIVNSSYTRVFFLEHVGKVLHYTNDGDVFECFNTRLMTQEIEKRGYSCEFDPEKQTNTQIRPNPYFTLTIQRGRGY